MKLKKQILILISFILTLSFNFNVYAKSIDEYNLNQNEYIVYHQVSENDESSTARFIGLCSHGIVAIPEQGIDYVKFYYHNTCYSSLICNYGVTMTLTVTILRADGTIEHVYNKVTTVYTRTSVSETIAVPRRSPNQTVTFIVKLENQVFTSGSYLFP